MSKTKCPKKGSPHQTSWGMTVVATGKCVGNKAVVVSDSGSVIELAKAELKTVKGEKRERILASPAVGVALLEASSKRRSSRASASTIPGLAPGVARIHADPAAAARYFVGGPRAAVVASGAMPAVVPQAASYAPAAEVSSEYMVPRWDPMMGQMRYVRGTMPAAVMEPEMYSGGYQFFDGLSGVGDLGAGEMHPYGMSTTGVLKWHGEIFERDMEAQRCDSKAVTALHQVRSEIANAFHEGIINGVEMGRMDNQVVRLFNKACVVKPRR